MKHASIICAVAGLLVIAGCTEPNRTTPEFRLTGDTEYPDMQVGDDLPTLPPRDNPYNVVSISPDDARTVPEIQVRRCRSLRGAPLDGDWRTIVPARPREITIVIFAGMHDASNKFALRKVNELVRKYRNNTFPVAALGIIVPTIGVQNALAFRDYHKITYDFYEDSHKLEGLREMAKAAGVDTPAVGELPAVFIVNARQKVRYFRSGFKATALAAVKEEGVRPDAKIIENVPEDATLESGLRVVMHDG